jgi:hypothetical protein
MLAATLLAALAVAAPSPAQLLARHVPVLVLAGGEPSLPSPVEPFLAAAPAVDGRLDVAGCDAQLGPASIACYAPLNGSPTVYGRALRLRDRVVLAYWLFYPYNLWTVETPSAGTVWRSHEGDWEEVVVVLDRKGTPLQVGYSQHCGGERRTWARAPRRGLRPVAYVALGSHANYPAPGVHRHDPRCWPVAANVVFDALRTTPVDRAGGGATIRPRLLPLAPAPAWLSFPGPWGETGWFHAGEATLAYGAGPLGPAFHAEWRAPLRELARWPLRR